MRNSEKGFADLRADNRDAEDVEDGEISVVDNVVVSESDALGRSTETGFEVVLCLRKCGRISVLVRGRHLRGSERRGATPRLRNKSSFILDTDLVSAGIRSWHLAVPAKRYTGAGACR